MINKNLLVKHDEETDDRYGSYPNKRTISQLLDTGFIVIDKDSGPTSHQTSDYVKKVLDLELEKETSHWHAKNYFTFMI